MYKELVKRLREESEIERWLQPHSANETPKLLDDAAHAIEELSKKRKTGKWCADYDYAEYDFDGSTPLPEPRKFQDGWKCSLCGGYSPSESHFCPNCGAEMIGGDE